MARRKPVADPRAGKVVGLRRAGIPWPEIVRELSLRDREQAELLFEQGMAALRVKYDTELELDRLDRLHLAAWPKASAGDLGAIKAVLEIAKERKGLGAKPVDNDHRLRKAFDASVESSELIDLEVDAAAIETGRTMADRIDEAIASGEGQEVTKALYLAPHLMNVLKSLLATPDSRLQKALLDAKAAEEDEDERELSDLQAAVGAKVTPIRKGRNE